MKYLKVSRHRNNIALTLTPEALAKPLDAVLSWMACILARYSDSGFSARADLSQYGLHTDFDIEHAFARDCEALTPVARMLHDSLMQWGKKSTGEIDQVLDLFSEFSLHRGQINNLKPLGATPKYSLKKQRHGAGVIMTLREDVISKLGPSAASLCISALSKAIAREKGCSVAVYNPFTQFKNSTAPSYASFSFWLMTQAFLQHLTDMPWSIAQVKRLIPSALALEEFFSQHRLPIKPVVPPQIQERGFS